VSYLYGGFIERVSKSFDAAFSAIEAGYNFDYGIEFEVALCTAISRLLPERFSVCRGYVINKAGEKAGDDIIIYERHLFPAMRFLSRDDYSLKEQVPIEAVAAYIEAKHTLELNGNSPSSFIHTISQVEAVKTLCNQRDPVPLSALARGVELQGFELKQCDGYPDIRNPMYTAIISRRVREKKDGKSITDSAEIAHVFATRDSIKCLAPPDIVVAGASNILLPYTPVGLEEKRINSPFIMSQGGHLTSLKTDKLAFALGICHLLWALDHIHLGSMPWPEVMKDALGPQ
jgi:hypothetical protein